jgi:hypothetical protein
MIIMNAKYLFIPIQFSRISILGMRRLAYILQHLHQNKFLTLQR